MVLLAEIEGHGKFEKKSVKQKGPETGLRTIKTGVIHPHLARLLIKSLCIKIVLIKSLCNEPITSVWMLSRLNRVSSSDTPSARVVVIRPIIRGKIRLTRYL